MEVCNNVQPGWPLGDMILELQPQGENVLHLSNSLVLFPLGSDMEPAAKHSTCRNDDLLLSHYANTQAVTTSGREELESVSKTFRLFNWPPEMDF